MEVYAKYITAENNFSSNIASLSSSLATAFGNITGTGVTSEVSSLFESIFDGPNPLIILDNGDNDDVPKGYLNYILFDKNFVFKYLGFVQVTEDGNGDHERLAIEDLKIDNPGYIFIYVSNETNDNFNIYFDDLQITHKYTPIVVSRDYYPFGLPMAERSYSREEYRHGYQGAFAEKDEETGWDAFQLRMYDARVARWISPDPYGQYSSPYMAMGNTVGGVDPDGGLVWDATSFWATLGGATVGAIIGGFLNEDDHVSGAFYGFIAGAAIGYFGSQISLAELDFSNFIFELPILEEEGEAALKFIGNSLTGKRLINSVNRRLKKENKTLLTQAALTPDDQLAFQIRGQLVIDWDPWTLWEYEDGIQSSSILYVHEIAHQSLYLKNSKRYERWSRSEGKWETNGWFSKAEKMAVRIANRIARQMGQAKRYRYESGSNRPALDPNDTEIGDRDGIRERYEKRRKKHNEVRTKRRKKR